MGNSAVAVSRSSSCDGRGRKGGVLSMAAAAAEGGKTAAKAPWLDGTMPRKLPDEISAENPLRVVIAGGGVGGLLAAKYLKMQGHDVSETLVRTHKPSALYLNSIRHKKMTTTSS